MQEDNCALFLYYHGESFPLAPTSLTVLTLDDRYVYTILMSIQKCGCIPDELPRAQRQVKQGSLSAKSGGGSALIGDAAGRDVRRNLSQGSSFNPSREVIDCITK